MLKVCITGTTRGLGKDLHDYFVNKGYHVIAFNRESDISEAAGCDLLINNTYGIQLDILNQLYASVGKMVVMGSIVTDFPDIEMLDYTAQKTKLEERVLELKSPNVLLLKLSSTAYNDSQVVINAIEYWLENPLVNIISFRAIGAPNRG
jgi:NAD(P)-dependent dehydrogenase (short-subunit alcohol dehydrogenase family)